MALAGPALAQAQSGTFHHDPNNGVDVTSWYWDSQHNEVIEAGPIAQRVALPNPQRPDTLPIAVSGNEDAKMSAIKFDLTLRNVTPGSQINKLIVKIEERAANEQEVPPYFPERAKIEACRITDILAAGAAEQVADAPAVSDTECVEGTREAPVGAAPVWTFDLTPIAQAWGQDPFGNNGVMLRGMDQQPPNDSWQILLKVPDRNNYAATQNRATMELAFVPGAGLGGGGGGEPGGGGGGGKGGGGKGGGGGGGGSGSTTGTSTGSTGGTVPGATTITTPSTDFSGTGGSVITGSDPAPTTPASDPVTAAQPLAQTQAPEPRLPAYVWLLIPLGLLALSAVRSVVLEPVGGPRPDGVIAAIRKRNAERRGGALRELRDPLARAIGAVRRGTSAVRRAFSRNVRSVRKT